MASSSATITPAPALPMEGVVDDDEEDDDDDWLGPNGSENGVVTVEVVVVVE